MNILIIEYGTVENVSELAVLSLHDMFCIYGVIMYVCVVSFVYSSTEEQLCLLNK